MSDQFEHDELAPPATVDEAADKVEDIPISDSAEQADDHESTIPTELPILPLRGLVVYPLTAIPLTVGQPRSMRLVDDVVAGDRLIGLVTAKDPGTGNPRTR